MKNDLRSLAACSRGGLAVLALAALTPAQAGTTFQLANTRTIVEVLPGGGWRVAGFAGETAAAGRVFSASTAAGRGVAVIEGISASGRAGALAIQVAQRVSVAEAAGVIARCWGSPVCMAVVGVASVAGPLLLDAYRCKSNGGTVGGVNWSGVSCDAGTAPVMQLQYCTSTAANAICGQYMEATYSAAAAAYAAGVTGYTSVSSVGTPSCNSSNLACTGLRTRYGVLMSNGTMNYSESGYAITLVAVQKPTCPSSPAGSPAGVGSDGKCATGNYTPATVDDVKAKVVAAPPAAGSVAEQRMVDGVKDAVSVGGESAPSTISTSGPASQTGTPTSSTTTDANGTTTKTTTPKYDYNYDGDTITYATSETVQTCVGANSCSSTTTTQAPPKPQDPEDPCTANPNRVGCMELGTAPDDKIPKKTQDVSFTSESLGLAASCPADVALPHGQSISYATLCGGLTQTRPLIIAMGFLMAGGILVAALRR